MLKKNSVAVVLAVAGLMIGASASAQVYVGGSLGQAKTNVDCAGTTKCDKISATSKIFGGYNIDKNFAIEASYDWLGKIGAQTKEAGVTADHEIKAKSFELAGVVKHDFTDELSGFAKLGVARVTADGKSSLAGSKYTYDTSSTQPVIGLGLNYKISKEVALRGEFESRRVKLFDEKARVNTFTVGAQYSF
ncbi:MAG: outer membrane beta-barrel protein [Burkholderiales bacterium]|nr:outer membrane beta-barrel protein [Burkholderiales bacterium]